MQEDLGLQALAQIQALEALPWAQEFRDRWLNGAVLGGRDEAAAWIARELNEPSPAYSYAVTEYVSDPVVWLSFRLDGQRVGDHTPAVGSAVCELGVLARRLSVAFGNEWLSEGAAYVLSGNTPRLKAVSARIVGGPRSDDLPKVSGPLNLSVELRVRPQATLAMVSECYQEALKAMYESFEFSPRERVKPMSSEKMRDLAVLGARIALDEFATWNDAVHTFNAEYPQESAYRKLDNPNTMRLFRRDVKAGYKRVTGATLDFQPERNGTPSSVSVGLGGKRGRGLTWRDGEVTTDRVGPIPTREDFAEMRRNLEEADSD